MQSSISYGSVGSFALTASGRVQACRVVRNHEATNNRKHVTSYMWQLRWGDDPAGSESGSTNFSTAEGRGR